ncbi:MAG: hypothetical protein NVSMB52_00290 [Chloroflexota bacterium]
MSVSIRPEADFPVRYVYFDSSEYMSSLATVIYVYRTLARPRYVYAAALATQIDVETSVPAAFDG